MNTKIMEDLQYHHAVEDVPAEVHGKEGWKDVKDLVEPIDKLLQELWVYCDGETHDGDVAEALPDYMRGRNDLAERIQQMIAGSGVLL